MSVTNCKAAFNDIYVDKNGDVLPCCYIQRNNQSKIGDIDDLNDWFFNDKGIQSLRNNLSTGIKDKRCEHCWKTEEKGQWTLRSATPFNSNTPAAKLLHITGGKLCNMACRMCSPDLSSMIHAENRPWQREDSNDPYNWIDDPEKAKKLINMINLQDLNGIQIQGGEPQLMKGYVDILEQITDDKKRKIDIQVTTNASVFNERFWKQIVKFNAVTAGISIDAPGKRFGVIRYNGVWDTVERNCNTILNYLWQNHKSVPPSINLNIVLQLSNIDQCNEMVAFYDDIKHRLPGLLGGHTLIPVTDTNGGPWDIANVPLDILKSLPEIESNGELALEWKQYIKNAIKHNQYNSSHREMVLSREKYFKSLYGKCLWDLKPEWHSIYEKEI